MKDPFSIYNTKFSRSSKPSLDWEEGALFDAQEPDDYYEGLVSESNIGIYIAVLSAIFLVLFGRLGFLQIVKGQAYRVLAENNRLRVQEILAPRGIIYDSQNKPLVENVPSFELVVTPADLAQADVRAELERLKNFGDFDIEEVLQKIKQAGSKSFRAISVIQDMPKDKALVFESNVSQYPGFTLEHNPIRNYQEPQIFSHLLGYTGKITEKELTQNEDQGYALNDYIGKTGIEYAYEQYLKGTSGKKQVEVDAKGNLKNIHGEIDPQPGHPIVLNIDGDLQREIYKNIVAKNGNKKAAAIALNPQTGQVLALVSLPGFDNNLFSRGISQKDYSALINDPSKPLFNRAVTGTYPPGSTIKLAVAAAALQEKVVDENTTIYDDGALNYNGFIFRGWKLDGLGPMTVRSAIAWSSDIYFYTVGGGQPGMSLVGLGPERLAKYYHLFGMGQKLGIDLPGEQPGVVADPDWKKQAFKTPEMKIWYPGDTYHISIGQGDMLTTPLQVAAWTMAVANGGTLYQPYLLNRVLDDNGNTVFQNEPKVIRAGFIDPKNIEIVRQGMRETVVSGTARSLSALPITAAGKTGTAQFDAADPRATHAWFTAFAPYENPQIVIVVLIEAGGEGSSAASPVVRETLKWWAENRYNKPQ